MNKFHHGGRIGDLVYALYTMKALGGGDLYLSPRQSPGWDLTMAQEMVSFLNYQPYINDIHFVKRYDVEFIDYFASHNVDYDLVDGERTTPDQFPEFKGGPFPGDIHIGKRYATAFNLSWSSEPWLIAPKSSGVDVVFHCPLRRAVRPQDEWIEIIKVMSRYLNIIVVDHLNEWDVPVQKIAPNEFIETATYINTAKLILGGSSSVGALAEGLGKPRFLELCDGGKGQNPTKEISTLSVDDVLELVYNQVNG